MTGATVRPAAGAASRRRRRARLRRSCSTALVVVSLLLGAGGWIGFRGWQAARPPAERRRAGPGVERPGAGRRHRPVPSARSPRCRSRRPPRAVATGGSGLVARPAYPVSRGRPRRRPADRRRRRRPGPARVPDAARIDLASLVPTRRPAGPARLRRGLGRGLTAADQAVQRTRRDLAAVPAGRPRQRRCGRRCHRPARRDRPTGQPHHGRRPGRPPAAAAARRGRSTPLPAGLAEPRRAARHRRHVRRVRGDRAEERPGPDGQAGQLVRARSVRPRR